MLNIQAILPTLSTSHNCDSTGSSVNYCGDRNGHPSAGQRSRRRWTVALSAGMTGLMLGWGLAEAGLAASADTAPPELLDAIESMDAAANQADIGAVMDYYSPNFSSADGLDYQDMEQTLSELWERYPNLTYETQLLEWAADGSSIIAETLTLVTGAPTVGDRPFDFTATIESRQRFIDGQIVEQEVLSEETVLVSGQNSPTIQINLPEQVAVGSEFVFDAIVLEPLDGRRLLGMAIDEPVDVAGYLNPANVELEVLSAGGLFKIGQAPATPGSRWISAVLVREDGITIVTRRLQVVADE
jgi:hypothetical protein